MSDYPISPTDPAELIPWLRALPVGAVLLDKDSAAWQVRKLPYGPTPDATDTTVLQVAIGSAPRRWSALDTDMQLMAKWAPYQVLHTPPTGGA